LAPEDEVVDMKGDMKGILNEVNDNIKEMKVRWSRLIKQRWG